MVSPISRLFPVTLLLASSLLAGEDIHLSPQGAISTIEAALEAAQLTAKPVSIIVEAGNYPLKQTLRMTEAHSQISWQAAAGAQPIFSGGVKLTGWQQKENGLWSCPLTPEVAQRGFEQLWVNGRRATRARTPNQGYYHIPESAPTSLFPGVERPDLVAFSLTPEHYKLLQDIPPAEREQLLMTVMHTWAAGHFRVQDLMPANTVRIKGKSAYPFVVYEQNQRFWLENYRAGLDAAGEWYLDQAKAQLLYLPLLGEDMQQVEAVIPQTELLLEIKGAQYITFNGICFQHQNYQFPKNGFHDGQAAVMAPSALRVQDSSDIHFLNCEFSHLGGHALRFMNGCADSSVKHSHLHDLGGGGIYIGERQVPSAIEQVNHHIHVDDCIIQHAGRIHPAASGVVFTHTRHCSVTHCDIGDLYYSGVSAGWVWGYGESLSRETRVENNHIHHLGWAQMSDMGGYYGLGSSPGTVIRGNHIHHIASHRYGAWGLYNDEGSTDTLMENNLVHDTKNSGFQQHYGRCNVVRNNIFAFAETAQLQRSRNEPHLTFIFERNILTWEPSALLLDGGDWNWKFYEKTEKGHPKDSVIFRSNLYWPTDGKIPALLSKKHWTWEEWQKMGRDQGSLFADPQFENASKRDFRLRADSPASKIGFKPWDFSLAGVRKTDAPWVKLAAQGHDYPHWNTQSYPAPAYAVPLQTFEYTPLGAVGLRNAGVDHQDNLKKHGASVGVTDEAASPLSPQIKGSTNQRSLKIQDADGLKPSWEPVMHLLTSWQDEPVQISFDLMLQPDASGFFEIRAGVNGEYAAGPLLSWANNKLTCGKDKRTELGSISPSEWVHISIKGSAKSKKYSVSITRADGSVKESTDIECKPGWKDSSTLLISSTAAKKTAFYLDNVQLRSEAH